MSDFSSEKFLSFLLFNSPFLLSSITYFLAALVSRRCESAGVISECMVRNRMVSGQVDVEAYLQTKDSYGRISKYENKMLGSVRINLMVGDGNVRGVVSMAKVQKSSTEAHKNKNKRSAKRAQIGRDWSS